MSIMSRIIHFVGGIFFERPVRGMSAEALRAKLSASQSTFLAALRDKSDSAANKELLAHIIGIERWAQARIKQAHTGVIITEEYDGYRPAPDTSYVDLVHIADTTRTDSIALLQAVTAANIALTTPIEHPQFGTLSLAAWFQYILSHSMIEAKKLR
jgi:hypothetical protein